MTRRLVLCALVGVAACGGEVDVVSGRAPPSTPRSVHVPASVDVATEDYVCVTLDAPGLAGEWVRAVTWNPPGGAVRVHHASLFAVNRDGPLGNTPCETPGLAPLGVYTPGTSRVALPDGVGVRMGVTQRLVMLTHAMRSGPGAAEPFSVELELTDTPPSHAANWIDVFGDVPVLIPHQSATTGGSCTITEETHLLTAWPHMHKRGWAFSSHVTRRDGTEEPLFTLPTWDFSHQLTYPISMVLQPGDTIHVGCTYFNDSEDIVVPGLLTNDEMCVLGLFAWPNTATCTPAK